MLKPENQILGRLKCLICTSVGCYCSNRFLPSRNLWKADEISAVKVNDLAAIVEAKVEEITKDVLKDSLKAKPYVVPEKSKMYGGRWVSGDSSTVYSADSVVIFNDSICSSAEVRLFYMVAVLNGYQIK